MAKLMISRKQISGIDDGHMPDKTWLLAVLGTFNPKLEYFKKGYVPPPKVAALSNLTKVDLPEDFLDGLPASKRKVKVRRLRMMSNSKTEGKMMRFKALKEKFSKEYLREKNKLDAQRHHQRNSAVHAQSSFQSNEPMETSRSRDD